MWFSVGLMLHVYGLLLKFGHDALRCSRVSRVGFNHLALLSKYNLNNCFLFSLLATINAFIN